MNLCFQAVVGSLLALSFSAGTLAQTDAGTLDMEDVAHNKADYSPFVDRHVPDKVLWGTLIYTAPIRLTPVSSATRSPPMSPTVLPKVKR